MQDLRAEMERLRRQARAAEPLEASLLKESGLRSDARILELGCGPGFVTDLLGRLAPQGTIVAADYSHALVSQVSHSVEKPPAGGLFPICTSGHALAVADGWADFCYSRFLLQHVPAPERLLLEVHRAIAPGGLLCVVDSDDGLILEHPESGQLSAVLQQAQAVQAERGGDRFIGRKLSGLFTAAGFKDVRTRIVMLTPSQLPFEILFNIMLGYKASLSGRLADLGALYAQLKPLSEAGRYFLAAGVVAVVGAK
jgi:SAM-dependent methyltransferase